VGATFLATALALLIGVGSFAGGQGPVAKRPRGARPSPRWAAFTRPHFQPTIGIPASFGTVPPQLDCWGNCDYGDCVSAEEAFKLAAYSVQLGASETFVPSATIVSWASKHGFLNGADLTSVMDAMASDGISVGGQTLKDGPYASVDFTSDATLSSAIFTGPVKIGIAADQLEGVVGSTNGWWLTGATADQNEDHCVCLLGYGTATQLGTMLNVAVPSGVDPSTRCYLLGTWGTIGIIDQKSLINICSEAWTRTPSTIPSPVPTPTPTPTPVPPTPTPIPPTPTPGVITLPAGNYTISIVNGATVFTPAPSGQTITFSAPVSSIQILETPSTKAKKP